MIFSMRVQPIVRKMRARIKGFWSSISLTNVLTARMTKPGCFFAYVDEIEICELLLFDIVGMHIL